MIKQIQNRNLHFLLKVKYKQQWRSQFRLIQPAKKQQSQNKKPKQPPFLISSRYNYSNMFLFMQFFQQFWRVLFLIVSIIMLILANKIYLFHTLEQFKDVKKGNLLDLLKYCLPFAFLYIGIDYLIHYFFDNWVDQHILRQDKYTEIELRKKKSRLIVRWGFNIFYYSFTSIVGYLLIKNTSFMPPILGGNGSVYTLADHRQLEEATIGMEIYYYIQFGKHVGRYFCHAFIQPEGSYYEYMLHHSLATFLILFSYAMDMWVIGIFVLIVHDCSDVFLAIARMYRQFKNRIQWLLTLSYLFAIGSWIGLRIIAFSYCCVFAGWYQYIQKIHTLNQIEIEVFSLPYIFMASMMTCLQFMHLYWTYFIIESFISVSTAQKIVRHSYD